MKKLKALNKLIKSMALKGSKSEYDSLVRDMKFAKGVGRDNYLTMAGATFPTLGKLAEATGILPEGHTLAAVQKAASLFGIVMAAASAVVIDNSSETAVEVAQLDSGDLT